MKFTVEREVLAEAVTWTARSLPARPPVPVLAGLLIRSTDSGTLVFSGFDYEVSAQIEIPADVAEPGEVLVSGRLLAEIARSLSADTVTVAQDGHKLVLTCGSSRFTLMAMPREDYPARPAMPEEVGQIAPDVFATAVSQVIHAASGRDDALPVFTAVRMEIDGDTLTLLATDRYRLALRTLTWKPTSPDAEGVALVPARTLAEVSKTIGSGADVSVALSEPAGGGGRGLIGFTAGGRQMTSTLVVGEYPKVRSVFPAESPIHAVVSTAGLVEATKRVGLVAKGKTLFNFTDGQVSLEAGDTEDAQASEAVEATLVGGEISIAFNPHYLLDGLAAISTQFVRLSFTQSTKPVVLTGQSDNEPGTEDDDSYQYLLMPVRI